MRTLLGKTLLWTSALTVVSFASSSAGQSASARDGLIDLRFRGGSATEYIAAVRDAAGELNILVAPEATDVTMPPVTLKKVSVGAALDLLEGKTSDGASRHVRLKVIEVPMHAEGERRTFQVAADVRTNRTQLAGAYVWTISNLLNRNLSSKAILSAIEMALEVVGSDTPLDVRFHEETGLLIATGDESQMQTIDGVLSQLSDAAAERRKQETNEEIVALRQELTRMEMLENDLRRMLDSKEQELTLTREQLHATERSLEQERSRRDSIPSDQRR